MELKASLLTQMVEIIVSLTFSKANKYVSMQICYKTATYSVIYLGIAPFIQMCSTAASDIEPTPPQNHMEEKCAGLRRKKSSANMRDLVISLCLLS